MDKIKERKAQEWFDKYIVNLNNQDQIINRLMTSTYYIKWLIEYTNNKKVIIDDEHYYDKNMSKTDINNTKMLELYYKGIDRYAKENYLYPKPCQNYYFGNYYNVKFNKYAYEIGCIVKGTTYYCKRIPLEENKEYIDLYKIMIGKKPEKTEEINSSLESLSNMVETLYKNGVPSQAIISTIKNTINNLESKEKKNKTMKKTIK